MQYRNQSNNHLHWTVARHEVEARELIGVAIPQHRALCQNTRALERVPDQDKAHVLAKVDDPETEHPTPLLGVVLGLLSKFIFYRSRTPFVGIGRHKQCYYVHAVRPLNATEGDLHPVPAPVNFRAIVPQLHPRLQRHLHLMAAKFLQIIMVFRLFRASKCQQGPAQKNSEPTHLVRGIGHQTQTATGRSEWLTYSGQLC